jgi:hypothetical protein
MGQEAARLMRKQLFGFKKRDKNASPLNFQAQFSSPAVEEKYRAHNLGSEKKQLKTAIRILLIPNFLFAYSDYILFAFSPRFFLLLTVRSVFTVISVSILLFLFRIKRYRSFDMLALGWWFSLIALIIFINTTRPAGYVHHVVIDILVLFSMYVIIPNRLINQALPAFIFSTADILLILLLKNPLKPVVFNVLLFSYGLANVMGLFVSRRFHVTRRLEFAALEKEKELREELQNALSEIKVLRGILPICSNCKKIRNDEGFWEQVDEYVSDHSEADFTHSMCPDCIQTLYPGLKLKE